MWPKTGGDRPTLSFHREKEKKRPKFATANDDETSDDLGGDANGINEGKKEEKEK